MNGHIMNTKERLDLLEIKMDLIMDKLGITMNSEKTVEQVIDNSSIELELQKTKNQIRASKIKFRSVPPRSPVREEILKEIEMLIEKQSKLEAELSASK